jgi:mannonate dehydratase
MASTRSKVQKGKTHRSAAKNGAVSRSPEFQSATPIRVSRVGALQGIKLSELFEPNETHKIRLAAQVGITHAIVDVSKELKQVPRDRYTVVLGKIKSDFQAAGMSFSGVESHPVLAEKIKLGLQGRDEEIENYMAAIKALARLDVRMICYNWMAGLGWYRTRTDESGRGGALISEFDNKIAQKQGLTEWGEVKEEKIWNNLEYFLRSVIPVAEQEGVKMALHPDDPPLSPLRGIARILTSADSYRRIFEMFPSPINGVTFCQANFKLMGEDIAALAHEWSSQKKIFFVHFRDVAGTRSHFRETFHDCGPTDLAQMLRIYHDCGFEGPIRPDHAPTLDGESNERPGYAMGGKILAIGYMKGVMDAFKIPYC